MTTMSCTSASVLAAKRSSDAHAGQMSQMLRDITLKRICCKLSIRLRCDYNSGGAAAASVSADAHLAIDVLTADGAVQSIHAATHREDSLEGLFQSQAPLLQEYVP